MPRVRFELTIPVFQRVKFFFLLILFIRAVRLWVLAATTGLLYQPRMIGDGDCGEIGGMKIGRGNRSIRRKSEDSSCLRQRRSLLLASLLIEVPKII
jgi:hypothetical protein